ncbi:transcriptional regulator [Desulfitobacterium dichloroeliminans LMG P-21439]|uniref:Transcriptional regulator n=1 Tax=Desulfitobacterium dichloroeliminans (strain LMG P-21439 / DCA1) TaxID=871963 RepID=L0F415_DESDL|nr:LysR family transcriptional regulator [Desulfitobacterium dichloroeliminans]AGA67673.1 transcriptional regulator [Desulfitobacterium dichloroeliminans LMG P-21439]
MRIYDLKLLIELSHSNSISLTSERMHITQQGLSQLIARVEQELNVKLFDRSRHGIKLTEAGQKTVQKAKEILEKYEELTSELEILNQQQTFPVEGDLILSHSHVSGTTVLPKALKLYKSRYPEVNLTIYENSPYETIALIKKDPRVVGIINFPETYYQDDEKREWLFCPDLEYKEFLRNELILCVPKSWALSKQQMTSVDEIIELPMVYYETSQYGEIITQMFRQVDKKPNIFLKTLNNELFRQTILDGLAMGVFSTHELNDNRLLRERTQQTSLRITLIYTWASSGKMPMPYQAQKFLRCLENTTKMIIE